MEREYEALGMGNICGNGRRNDRKLEIGIRERLTNVEKQNMKVTTRRTELR